MTRGKQAIRNCAVYIITSMLIGPKYIQHYSENFLIIVASMRITTHSVSYYIQNSQNSWNLKTHWEKIGKNVLKHLRFFLQITIFTQFKISPNLCKKSHLEKKTLVLMYSLTNIHTSYTVVSPAAIMQQLYSENRSILRFFVSFSFGYDIGPLYLVI